MANTPRSVANRDQKPRERVPFGAPRPKMEVQVDLLRESGYHLHWFNDQDNRVHDALNAYYEFVTHGEIGMPLAGVTPGSEKDRVARRVGTHDDGAPLMAYLMKIRQEYHMEDEATKFAQDAERVADMRRGITDEMKRDQKGFYEDGISVKRDEKAPIMR